jgi:hypothetical protein
VPRRLPVFPPKCRRLCCRLSDFFCHLIARLLPMRPRLSNSGLRRGLHFRRRNQHRALRLPASRCSTLGRSRSLKHRSSR